MALPTQFKLARATDYTLGRDIDDVIGELEQVICDVFGLTIDQSITAVQGGTKKVAEVELSAEATKTISSDLVPDKKYKLVWTLKQNTSDGFFYARFNDDSGANYWFSQGLHYLGGVADGGANGGASVDLTYFKNPTTHTIVAGTYFIGEMLFHCPPSSQQVNGQWNISYSNGGATCGVVGSFSYIGAADLSQLDIMTSLGTLTGKVALYEMT